MSMTDPIADLLTRIRNALQADHEAVEAPLSKMKLALVGILKQEGFIRDFEVLETKPQATLRIQLRYYDGNKPAILGLARASRSGRRTYYGAAALPKVRNGLGVGIVSTSRGVMTDRAAREANVGGELLCTVW